MPSLTLTAPLRVSTSILGTSYVVLGQGPGPMTCHHRLLISIRLFFLLPVMSHRIPAHNTRRTPLPYRFPSALTNSTRLVDPRSPTTNTAAVGSWSHWELDERFYLTRSSCPGRVPFQTQWFEDLPCPIRIGRDGGKTIVKRLRRVPKPDKTDCHF